MKILADLIVTNASVFTGDEVNPRAEAIAITGNKIVYVGTQDEVSKWRGPETRVIDGGGNTLMPGFIDSHFHLLWGCIWLGSAQLQEVKTKENLRKVLLDFANENKTIPWIDGRGIRYNIVSTRQELDAIISDRPVYVGAYDGHTAWANTKALEMAGILHSGKEIGPNGIVVRDEAGVATGELREHDAMRAVHDLVPEPSETRKRELLKLGMKQITATGVTSVHNMNGDMQEMITYAAMEDAGEMLLRVYVPYWIKPEPTEKMLKEAAEMAKVQGDYARGGAAKFFMDGV